MVNIALIDYFCQKLDIHKLMELNFKEIFTVFMVLFAVIDIVGNIPIIIDLRKKVGHIQSEKSSSIIAGVILIVFLFVG